MNYKNLFYSLTCLSFSVVIGAAIYEHIAVIPQWSVAPPKSLTMFQGEYGLDSGAFWRIIHPVTLCLFFISLILLWRSPRKINLIAALVGYIIVLITTVFYFVPELINITTTPHSAEVNSALTARAEIWEIASLVRLVFLFILSLILLLGLTKANIPIAEKRAATMD